VGLPLMPKATAMWLIDNTSLTFEQIADFCGLHILEIQAIANGDMDGKMSGFDPIASSQLTVEEIKRCESDENSRLVLKESSFYEKINKLRPKYTPKAKRQDKPDAIAWIVKYYPDIPEADICKLIGTTKSTIRAIKSKINNHSAEMNPKNPISLGLCSEAELDFVITKLKRE
jgi:hypothetical protein